MIEKLRFEFRHCPVTMTLLCLNIFIYLLSVIIFKTFSLDAYQALCLGAYNPLYVSYNHEYYRIIMSNFIHFSVIHILMNVYSMYGLGRFVERAFDTKEMTIIILSSMLCTSGLQYIIYLFVPNFGIYGVSAGMSGMIFGMIGALAALALYYKGIFEEIFRSLLSQVIMMFLISFVVTSISFYGHLFGLIGGFISTYLVLKNRNNTKQELLN